MFQKTELLLLLLLYLRDNLMSFVTNFDKKKIADDDIRKHSTNEQ